MAKKSLAENLLKVNPTEDYTRNGRRITSGYDGGAAIYFYRIDGGSVREFSTRLAMEKALELELTPVTRVPDLPQLPANVPQRLPEDWPYVNRARQRAYVQVRSTRGHSLPSRGVICLPAPKASEPLKPQLTTAQQAVADQFLTEATAYFNDLCAMDNRKMADRDRRHLKWTMDCHFQNMSNKAFTLAQMVSMGVL